MQRVDTRARMAHSHGRLSSVRASRPSRLSGAIAVQRGEGRRGEERKAGPVAVGRAEVKGKWFGPGREKKENGIRN